MDWIQVNNDGFVGLACKALNAIRPSLFVVRDVLCAKTEHGLWAMLGPPEDKYWVYVPLPNEIDLNKDYQCTPISWDQDYIYVFLRQRLYFIHLSDLPTGSPWHEVTSVVSSPDDPSLVRLGPIPMAVIRGQIYGFYHTFAPTGDALATPPVCYGMYTGFRVCRSSDIGSDRMNWEAVTPPSFGNTKNCGIAFITGGSLRLSGFSRVDRIFVGTNTLGGMFGNEQSYNSDGIEIWESSNGDLDSWTRSNTPGFGTATTLPEKSFFTNQMILSFDIAKTWDRDFLYVGTATHFPPGGQVWRYDLTGGPAGWQNVTPPWVPWPDITSGYETRRMTGIVGLDKVYVAEGFPSGNLGSLNGWTWDLCVPGPHPFAGWNQGFSSLVANTRWRYNLFAMTLPSSELPAEDKKLQVWATSCLVPDD